MEDTPRLIEHAFPLKQASLDSVHEKNVRHGHISTLHIWPARRPLAACRAALIATLLPDPSAQPKPDGMSDEEWHKEIIRQRQELCEKIGGRVVKKIEKKRMPNGQVVEREKEVTEGGILHWGRETENKETLEWFREEIRKAYDGRAPKVLDPFAGGGAIPLEAMRLGCEATASDINPVAWFILKCTLEYPQKLAGKTWPLPDFILENEEFMEVFYKAHPHLVGRTKWTKRQTKKFGDDLFLRGKEVSDRAPQADLAWHVRAWGQWVLDRARRELAKYYPTYADFEPLGLKNPRPYEKQSMRLVSLKEDGTPDVDALNAEFSKEYLADKHNPRWVAKPTVAYLWARTVTCKNCRATVPLLKTLWLCKKDKKRVLLTTEPTSDKSGVVFGIEANVPVKGGNAAQRREHDKRIGAGTMSRSGAKCPCCPTIMTREDIQVEGRQGRIGRYLTAVVSDGPLGKEYRFPTEHELSLLLEVDAAVEVSFAQLPFGKPREPVILDGKGNTWCSLYGVDEFHKVFASRQLLALGTLALHTRRAHIELLKASVPQAQAEAIFGLLTLTVGRLADFASTCVTWTPGGEFLGHTFVRWALPFVWDYCEGNPFSEKSGNYLGAVDWVARATSHTLDACSYSDAPSVLLGSAARFEGGELFDAVVTDPPYYDAIGYSVLMDFFYIWHRRILHGIAGAEYRSEEPLAPKWNHEQEDGELVDDSARFGGDKRRSRGMYESGMARAFQAASAALNMTGRMVIVFAHKEPNAWETLVAAIIQAGFVVDGSWPIMTERSSRMRSMGSAALSSSVWLICKKRPVTARPGWDNQVLEEMRQNIREKLREFWDAGIRGPDFVWAATGPAMEAYSKHPVVKKANDPGQVMTVSEFLGHVRRIVVDFVVGRVLSGDGAASADETATDRLDEPTAYYLLHRHDFGMGEAPAGACILYAISCGISDKELASTWDLIGFTKGSLATEDTEGTEDEDSVSSVDSVADPDAEEDSGSKVKLKTWAQRKGSTLGYEAPSGKPVPLIDRVHCLMHLWKAGDLHKVDEYLDGNGLRRQELFKRLVQSLIELSPQGSEERSLLESLSNHLQARGAVAADQQLGLSV